MNIDKEGMWARAVQVVTLLTWDGQRHTAHFTGSLPSNLYNSYIHLRLIEQTEFLWTQPSFNDEQMEKNG